MLYHLRILQPSVMLFLFVTLLTTLLIVFYLAVLTVAFSVLACKAGRWGCNLFN